MFKWITLQQATDLFNKLIAPILIRIKSLEDKKTTDLTLRVIQLEKDCLTLKENGDKLKQDFDELVSNLTYTEEVNCDEITWDNSSFIQENTLDSTIFTLAVLNSKNKKVEYKSNFEDWKKGKLTMPNTGECEHIWFRVEGCDKETWGCVKTQAPSQKKNKVTFITENC